MPGWELPEGFEVHEPASGGDFALPEGFEVHETAPVEAPIDPAVVEMSQADAELERGEGGRVMGRVMEMPEVSITGQAGGDPSRPVTDAMPAPSHAEMLRRVLPAAAVRDRARAAGELEGGYESTARVQIPEWLRDAASTAYRMSPVGNVHRQINSLTGDDEAEPMPFGETGVEPLPESMTLEGVVVGASQAMTLGHADEAAGALRSALTDETYEEARDQARDRFAAASADDPGGVGVGTALGTLLWFAVPGAGSIRALQAAPRAARVAAMAGEGAFMGGVAGAGASEAEAPGAVLEDALPGAAMGGAMAGLMGGGAEVMRARAARAGELGPGGVTTRATQEADDHAEQGAMRRLRSLTGEDRLPRRAFRELAGPRRGRAERVQRTVEDLRAAGIESGSDAGRVLDAASDDMTTAADRLDEAFSQGASFRENAPPGPSVERIAERMRERSMALRRDRGVGSDVADAIEAEAQRWEQAAESGPMTFGRAWRFRQEMGRPEYWTNGPRGAMNPAHSHRRDLYRIVREEMLQAADAADPQAADVFRQASSRYATVRPLAEAADEATFRAAQNRQLSLTDTIALGGGVASGNPVVGLAAAGANRLLRGNEHRLMARYHERAAQLARTRPERLGRYAQPLATAAQRGPKAFAATYFTLWNREPEFRQAIQQTDEPADLAEEMTDE